MDSVQKSSQNEKNSIINGQHITMDGGMSRLMITIGDYGWQYEE